MCHTETQDPASPDTPTEPSPPTAAATPEQQPPQAPTDMPTAEPVATEELCDDPVNSCPCDLEESMGADGFAFVQGLRATLSAEEQRAQGVIDGYDDRNWAHDDVYDGHVDFVNNEGPALRSRLETVLSRCCPQGDALLRVANIVFHEAGTTNAAGMQAVAYAWLNRTEGDATVVPSGAEISDYVDYPNRLATLTDANRRSFLRNFTSSLEAACNRLRDPDPSANDPTGGATHWVSPRSLPSAANGCSVDRYARDGVCFPNWTRRPDEPNVVEITVDGVDPNDFLFYSGVRY